MLHTSNACETAHYQKARTTGTNRLVQTTLQAFPISARTTDTSAAPTSAEAYLACVRAEAAALPDVFVSAVRAPVAPPSGHAFAALRRARAAYVPGWAAPCAVWAGELCYWFASLQQEVVRARGGRGVEVVPAVADGEAWRRAVWEVKGGAPRLEMVLAMDHVRVAKALDVFDSCLREAPRLDEKGGLREGGAVEAACIADDVLSGYRAQWLFSLLSCLLLYVSGRFAGV